MLNLFSFVLCFLFHCRSGGSELMYKSTLDTITKVVKGEGVLALWNGFLPYYLRCGGHTTSMFVIVEWLRSSVV